MEIPKGSALYDLFQKGKMLKNPQIRFLAAIAQRTGDYSELEAFAKANPYFVALAQRNIALEEQQKRENPFRPYPTRHEVAKYLSGELPLGVVNAFGDMFGVMMDNLCKLLMVLGRVGSGKTFLLKHIILQIFALQVRTARVIVIDPQRREYRGLLPLCPALKLITPNRLRINLLQPPPWIPPQEYIYLLADLMVSELQLGPYSRNTLVNIISYLYRDRGILDGSTNYPTLRDLLRVIRRLGGEAKLFRVAEAYTLLDNRLAPLLESGLFNCVEGIPWDWFRSRDLILELDGVQDQISNLITCLILSSLYQANVRAGLVDGKARTVVLIEEARALMQAERNIGDWGEAAFNQIIARGLRGAGIAVIVASQEPKSFSDTMVSICFTKICFPLLSGSDLDWVQKGFGLTDEQRHHIFKLPPHGQAVVRYGGFEKPFLLAVPPVNLAPTMSEEELEPLQGSFWAELDRAIILIPSSDAKPVSAKSAEIKPAEIKPRPQLSVAATVMLYWLGRNHFAKVSEAKVNKLFPSESIATEAIKQLIRSGLVTEEKYRVRGTRPATYLVLQPQALEFLGLEALPGKGSYEHKLYQNIIFNWAKGKGLNPKIEGKATKASTKLVNVLVQDERDRHVAYEVTLSNENLIHNLLADFQAGVSEVVVVNSTKTAQRECLDIVSRHPALTQYMERVSFRLIEEFAPQA